jgi:MFS family permease
MFINRAGGFVAPFLALYLVNERHLSVPKAGSIIALVGIGALGAGPVGGAIADRWGRRPALAVSTLGGASAMALLGLSRLPSAIAVAALAVGFFGEMYRAPCMAMVSDVVPPEQRERAFGLIYWAVNLGFAIAPSVAGVLASRSYPALFFVDAITTLVFGLGVVWLVAESRPTGHAAHHGVSHYLAPYRDGLFVAFSFMAMLVGMLFHQIGSSLPIDVTSRGISPGTFGAMISLNGVLITILQPFISRYTRRAKRVRVLTSGAALVGLGMGINGLAAGALAVYVTSIVVWTVGEIIMAGTSPSIVAEMAPPHLRGSYQGAFMISGGAAAALGPLAGAALLARFGSTGLWGSCLVAGLVAAAGYAVTVPLHVKRLERAREAARPPST